MGVGTSDSMAVATSKENQERRLKWKTHFITQGPEHTREYLAAGGPFWRWCARTLGMTRYCGALDALAEMEGKQT